jgi:hypothetical protein
MSHLGIAPLNCDSSSAYEVRLEPHSHRDPHSPDLVMREGAGVGLPAVGRKGPMSPRRAVQIRLPSLLTSPTFSSHPLAADDAFDAFDDEDDSPMTAFSGAAQPTVQPANWPATAFASLQHGIVEVVGMLEGKPRRRVSDDEAARRRVTSTPPPSGSKADTAVNSDADDGCGASDTSATSRGSDEALVRRLLEISAQLDDLQRQVTADRSANSTAASRLHSLQKKHDATTQKLVTASSKIATLTMLLHQERVASRAFLLHVAATAGRGACGGEAAALLGPSGSPTPAPSGPPSAAGDGDPFDIDDDGSPTRLALEPVVRSLVQPAGRSECACSILNTMRPHMMANDVLQCRRRLAQYIALIADNPAALAGHEHMLALRAEGRMKEIADQYSDLEAEKGRLLIAAL